MARMETASTEMRGMLGNVVSELAAVNARVAKMEEKHDREMGELRDQFRRLAADSGSCAASSAGDSGHPPGKRPCYAANAAPLRADAPAASRRSTSSPPLPLPPTYSLPLGSMVACPLEIPAILHHYRVKAGSNHGE